MGAYAKKGGWFKWNVSHIHCIYFTYPHLERGASFKKLDKLSVCHIQNGPIRLLHYQWRHLVTAQPFLLVKRGNICGAEQWLKRHYTPKLPLSK